MTRIRCIAAPAALASLLVAVPSSQALNEVVVQRAIVRGVLYLKATQQKDGTWDGGQGIGPTALAGLTLLECDVPANDPAVQKAAVAVRKASLNMDHTYHLALAVMLLDKLGESHDAILIESLTVRLMAGQNTRGGWDYLCPPVSPAEKDRLATHLDEHHMLVARRGLARPTDEAAGRHREISPEIAGQLRALTRPRRGREAPFGARPAARDDNSNTQFACLALWIARRHGLPVETALTRTEERFRKTQRGDGGWSYQPTDPGLGTTGTMTCAGLLGLAFGHGVAREAKPAAAVGDKRARAVPARRPQAPADDPAVLTGVTALAVLMNLAEVQRSGAEVAPRIGLRSRVRVVNCYYLWSLERVATAYGLTTLRRVNWYAWGALLLLPRQRADGSWLETYPKGGVDTCFALLFLRRANLAEDLSASLQGQAKDLGQAVLKAGGIGAEGRPPPRVTPAKGSQLQAVGKPHTSDAPKAADGKRAPRTVVEQEADAEERAARLGTELIEAQGARQMALMKRLQEAKGPEYTLALAAAVHALAGEEREKARDALAERLTRMTAKTLRAYLQQEDRELRSAAALACAMKEDKSLAPDLIELLQDADSRVRRAAHLALTTLAGKDFGPASTASPADRAAAAPRWKAWWKQEAGK